MSQRERADRHQDIEASHPNSLRKSLDYTHIFGDDRYPIDASPADRHIGDVEIGAAPQPELTRQRWGNARYWGCLPHLRDPAAKSTAVNLDQTSDECLGGGGREHVNNSTKREGIEPRLAHSWTVAIDR